MFYAENAKVFHGFPSFPLKKPREVMAKTGKASKAEGASEVRREAETIGHLTGIFIIHMYK
jgi:hypothetical protein